MKNLSQKFLSDDQQKKINSAVQKAEKTTSGEIVVMVVSSSYHYTMSNVVGGFLPAFIISMILSPFIGEMLWVGPNNMLIFIGLFFVFFTCFYFFVKYTPWLKRFFISKREIEEEVEEAAITHFFKEGLYQTRDKTGVLIFISVFEHKVWVLGDKGITDKLPEETWQEIVDLIVKGIKNRNQCNAICKAVEKVGGILKEHFPIQENDRDELKNVIVGK